MPNETDVSELGLRDAEARAATARDWLAAARGWVDLERSDDARRCVTTAVAQADGNDHLISASMVYTKLGDRDLAKELLDRDLQVLIANPPKAQRWRDLTNHYVVDCEDVASGVRCIELGLQALEPTVDNLCTFAMAYLRCLDEATARVLVARADAIATPSNWQILYKTHSAVGNSARAQELMRQKLAAITTVEECWKLGFLAKAEGPVMQRAVLARAEEIVAKSKPERRESEWGYIASGFKDWLGDKAEVRRCLGRMREYAFSDTTRAQVAHKFRFWVGERAIADDIAPWAHPSAMLVPRDGQTLAGWEVDRTRLFDWLRPQMTDDKIASIVGTISLGDQPVLEEIRDTGKLPNPMQAWSMTALAGHQHGRDGVDVDHVVRAFACTLASFGPFPTVSSLPALVESCRILGPEALAGVIGLLVAVHESEWDNNNSLARVRLAILIAATALDPADPRLPALGARVVADHQKKALKLDDAVWGRLLEGLPIAPQLR